MTILSNRLARWLIPCNDRFDIFGAFRDLQELDWRQTAKYQVGEIVYIYIAIPYQKIMFQTIVIETDIPWNDTIDDSVYVRKSNPAADRDDSYYEDSHYMKLRLQKYADLEVLALIPLTQHGLKTAPQGPMRLGGDLEVYVRNEFSKAALIDAMPSLPEEVDIEQQSTYLEGAKRQIIVNAYERDQLARSECIRIHGSKCVICNFDFGKVYGSEFDGKIHVHHKKPLFQIDDSYRVNPRDDLVPVCPNCHMILHARKDEVYTVEDVKTMIGKQR